MILFKLVKIFIVDKCLDMFLKNIYKNFNQIKYMKDTIGTKLSGIYHKDFSNGDICIYKNITVLSICDNVVSFKTDTCRRYDSSDENIYIEKDENYNMSIREFLDMIDDKLI